VAALNLILDFGFIEHGAELGLPHNRRSDPWINQPQRKRFESSEWRSTLAQG
jgi:hypothetical protein